MEKTYQVPLLLIVRAAGVGAILKKVLTGEIEAPDGFLVENMINDINKMIDGLAEIVPVNDLIEAERQYYGSQHTWIN